MTSYCKKHVLIYYALQGKQNAKLLSNYVWKQETIYMVTKDAKQADLGLDKYLAI